MRRHAALAVPVVLLAAVLAGCSNEDPTGGLPEFTPGASTSPGPTSSATPSPGSTETLAAGSDLPADGAWLGPKGAALRIGGTVSTTDADGEAAQLAYLRFWQVRIRAVTSAEIDDAALKEVAVGSEADRLRKEVKDLAAKKQRGEGYLVSNIRSVKVQSRKATLVDCVESFASTLDAKGRPVEAFRPSMLVYTVTLERSDEWRVSKARRVYNVPCPKRQG